MRTSTVWTVAAALVLGTAALWGAAQEPAPAENKGGLFSGLFGKKAEAPKAAPAKEPGPAKEEARPATSLDAAAAVRERELDAYLRRMAVCDKLRAIAEQTQDEALERKADQLLQRSLAVFQHRTAHLGQGGPGGGFRSDEQTLGRHLGGANLTEPAPAPPSLTLGALENNSGRTAARREKP